MRSQNDISAKFSALSMGEKLILIGGIVYVIAALILPWIKVSITGVGGLGGGSQSNAGVGEPAAIWGWLGLLVALGLAGVIIARIMDMQLPALPPQYTWGQVFAAGGGALVVFTLLKAWRIQAIDIGLCGDLCSKSFGLGFFIGIIAALAVGAGGYMLYTEEKGGSISGGFRR
jgi:hypothetical protein